MAAVKAAIKLLDESSLLLPMRDAMLSGDGLLRLLFSLPILFAPDDDDDDEDEEDEEDELDDVEEADDGIEPVDVCMLNSELGETCFFWIE